MEEREDRERFQLRSEKVRSIVGQVPPALTRYGMTIIAVAVGLILLTAALIPYRQVSTGTAVVTTLPEMQPEDSLSVTLRLRPQETIAQVRPGSLIHLQGESTAAEGRVIRLSARCDTLGYCTAEATFLRGDLTPLEASTTDYRITTDSGSLLSHILRGLL